MNFNNKIMCLSMIMASFLCASKGEAAIVKIINKSGSKIEANVVPEPMTENLPYCWKCLRSMPSSPNTSNIVVPTEALKGQQFFAVIGTEGGFLANGKCRNLNVSKNYEVSFIDDTVGVTCLSREI